ncbi:LytR family transcriptional regulator [Hydrococcus rivularis NIES-593]|uniref:LytR family transcriptional regulator n=1 Tax=Hydrococcus rivularis NIES-593 TaxID=1921803 RepID=A0A1U7HJ30_9CYAN|nr:LCP family protein [Hydrococcus rivularis]OKH23564.1 LytR family transcriptional regulator [Hydrococcus rivularis NIES-593]
MGNSVERFPRNSGERSQKTKNPTPPQKPKRLPPFYLGILWGGMVSFTAAISAIVGASIALVSPSSLNLVRIVQNAKFPLAKATNPSADESWRSLLQHSLSRPINILVMGVDRVPNAPKGKPESFSGYSDTVLLLRVDPSARSLRLLSIPKDSRVEVPDASFTKISQANLHGGPALAARVVSRSLNDVAIDRYVRITTDALRELVDWVGGVEVYVPYSMSYRDTAQNLEIDLQTGWQTLNGKQAEEFVRFRSDRDGGDLGRVQRQQIFLKALKKRLYNPSVLPRLPQAIQILQQQIDTNLSLEEMLALVSFGKDLNEENLTMVMLPGSFSQQKKSDAESYWIIAEKERDRIVDEYFDRAAQSPLAAIDPYKVKIAIQNATNDPGLANRFLDYLTQKQFQKVYLTEGSPELLGKTEIIAQTGNLEAASILKSNLGVGKVEASSTGDLDSDLTIRLGADAKQLLVGDSFLKKSETN